MILVGASTLSIPYAISRNKPKPKIEPTTEAATIYVTENLGEFKLTAYCSCSKCCGKWAKNRPVDENGREIVKTASGARAVAGYTVAADPSFLPFGTIVYIDGKKYCVQDSGSAVKGKHLDIYFDNHAEALKFGCQHKEVERLIGC
ncbi:MAG: 3D domain-containing protein [Bacteroidales bacterium]|nr:3D domain-containing protein [Bacteroidales bacterium]